MHIFGTPTSDLRIKQATKNVFYVRLTPKLRA